MQKYTRYTFVGLTLAGCGKEDWRFLMCRLILTPAN